MSTQFAIVLLIVNISTYTTGKHTKTGIIPIFGIKVSESECYYCKWKPGNV